MAFRNFRIMVCVTVGLVCTASYGEQLPELIVRLEKLDGKNPIRAMVHIEDRTSKTQDKDSKPLEKTELMITADANALTLTVTGEIPDTRIFREFSVLRAAELMHYGRSLADELAELKLVETRPDSHQGLSCTRWRLQSEQTQSKFGMSSTSRRDVELWIAADGYPVAASFKTQTKANVFLFKISSESARYQRYDRMGDRLVLILDRNETDVKTKAGDEKRTVTTAVETRKD